MECKKCAGFQSTQKPNQVLHLLVPPLRLKVCLSVKLVFGWKIKTLHTLGPPWHKFCRPALNQNTPPCSSTGVTVHAAVCGVCDPQSGRLDALLSERTDGQVHAHLPGRCTTLCVCVGVGVGVLSSTSRRNALPARCMGNVAGIIVNMFLVCGSVRHTDPLCMGMCAGGERSVCVLRAHSLLLHHRGGDPGPLPER